MVVEFDAGQGALWWRHRQHQILGERGVQYLALRFELGDAAPADAACWSALDAAKGRLPLECAVGVQAAASALQATLQKELQDSAEQNLNAWDDIDRARLIQEHHWRADEVDEAGC